MPREALPLASSAGALRHQLGEVVAHPGVDLIVRAVDGHGQLDGLVGAVPAFRGGRPAAGGEESRHCEQDTNSKDAFHVYARPPFLFSQAWLWFSGIYHMSDITMLYLLQKRKSIPLMRFLPFAKKEVVNLANFTIQHSKMRVLQCDLRGSAQSGPGEAQKRSRPGPAKQDRDGFFIYGASDRRERAPPPPGSAPAAKRPYGASVPPARRVTARRGEGTGRSSAPPAGG